MSSVTWSKHLAFAWAGLILLLTLFPGPEITGSPEDLPSILCLICGERGGGRRDSQRPSLFCLLESP